MVHPELVYIIYNAQRGGFLAEYSSFGDADQVGWSTEIHHFEEYNTTISIVVTFMYANSDHAITHAEKLILPDTYVIRYYPDIRNVDFSFPVWHYLED